MPLSSESRDLARFQMVRADSILSMYLTADVEQRVLRVRGPKSGTIYTVIGVTHSDKWIEIRLKSSTTQREHKWRRLPSNGIQVIRRGF